MILTKRYNRPAALPESTNPPRIWRNPATYPQDIAQPPPSFRQNNSRRRHPNFRENSQPPRHSAATPHKHVGFILDAPPPSAHKTWAWFPARCKASGDQTGMWTGRSQIGRPKTTAAPATVCGECFVTTPLGHQEIGQPGRQQSASTRKPGDRPCNILEQPPGMAVNKGYVLCTSNLAL